MAQGEHSRYERAQQIIRAGSFTTFTDLGRQLDCSRAYAEVLFRRFCDQCRREAATTGVSVPAACDRPRKAGNPQGAKHLLEAHKIPLEPGRTSSVLTFRVDRADLDAFEALPGEFSEKLREAVDLLVEAGVAVDEVPLADPSSAVTKGFRMAPSQMARFDALPGSATAKLRTAIKRFVQRSQNP